MKKQSRKNLEYLINNLSDTKIKNLIELLENKKLTIKSNDYELIKKLTLTTTEIDFVKDVFADFKNSESLILAITLLSEIKKLQHEKMISTSLVWTSPIFFHEDADKTDQVITDLLLKAKTSITIVGYAMTSDKHVENMMQAYKNGVNVMR